MITNSDSAGRLRQVVRRRDSKPSIESAFDTLGKCKTAGLVASDTRHLLVVESDGFRKGSTRLKSPHKTYAEKKQEPPPSPSQLPAGRSVGAKEVRTSTADGSDRGQRGDPACGRRAGEPRLSRDPQAD